MKLLKNKIFKIMSFILVIFIYFYEVSYSLPTNDNVKRNFWFDYDCKISLDNIYYEDGMSFILNDRHYITNNLDNLNTKSLNKDLVELNKKLDYMIKNGYVKTYIDSEGTLKRINNSFRIYPNEISNYIVALKIGIYNREMLTEIIDSKSDINQFEYKSNTFVSDSDLGFDLENLNMVYGEELLYFTIDALERDNKIPKSILNSLDIFISPLKSDNGTSGSLLGCYFYKNYQNRASRNVVFLGKTYAPLDRIGHSTKNLEDNFSDLRFKESFNYESGKVLYHEIGHAILKNYISQNLVINELSSIFKMKMNLYHDLDLDIINDLKEISDVKFSITYKSSIEEYFANAYAYYAYCKDIESENVYDKLKLVYSNGENLCDFMQKYCDKLDSFEKIPSFDLSIDNININYSLNEDLNLDNNKVNIKVKNNTNDVYTLYLKQKSTKYFNFIKNMLYPNGYIYNIKLEPGESYEKNLNLPSGEYEIEYALNNSLSNKLINLTLE